MNKDQTNTLEQYRTLRTTAHESFRQGELERALESTAAAASVARYCTSKWYDEELESLLSSIGERSIDIETSYHVGDTDSEDLKIIYLATFLSDQGGHSETLRLWTKLLSSREAVNSQEIILTNQDNEKSHFPALESELDDRGISIEQLDPETTYTDRIRELATSLASRAADRVILFVNPEDVVAVSTIGGLESTPQTIYFNHADHVFWLGQRAIDEVVEYRSVGRSISNRFRNIDSHYVVPLTTDIEISSDTSQLLDLEAETVSVSVGSQYKVRPNFGYNYFEAINRLLKRNPRHAHLLVTDGSVGEFMERYVSPTVRDRFHVRGPVADLEPVYKMADVILDTIPYSGGMTRLEALACGIPMVAFEMTELSFLSNSDIFTDEYQYITQSDSEFVRSAEELLTDSTINRKTRKQMRKRFDRNFALDVVGDRLSAILTGDGPFTSWSGRKSDAESFDMTTYARHFRSRPRPNKRLLENVMSKESPRNVTERVKIYRNALEGGEFETSVEKVGYLGLALVGSQGYPLAKKVHETTNRISTE